MTMEDKKRTMELTLTAPVGKVLQNTLIKEKFSVPVIKLGINQVIIKKAMVIIPAIIWFSVKLEANIPKEM